MYEYEIEYDDGQGYTTVWGSVRSKKKASEIVEELRKDHPLIWINKVLMKKAFKNA